ncbi:arylsulfotransferase family protein [Haloarcula marina]|uniref:arylsulfotransferase family protein n=1 Tax=Haloarcula marina TaxID=2961574 RepID=UPI0020B751C2|nr:arylsulfotransferase family protein [Halomicroarcula marina]
MRLAVALVVLLALASLGVSALTYEDPVEQTQSEVTADQSITFVSTQGRLSRFGNGRIVAFDTERQTAVWTHTEYDRYFDVDPIGDDKLLFAAVEAEPGLGQGTTYAVLINWRTGEQLERFQIPPDVHDVDYLGNHEYIVADKFHHKAYIRNTSREKTVWEFDFTKRFPDSAGNGPPEPNTEYSHLNDVDPVNNGSAFLLSPRNFDRVILVNRSTKNVTWQLGEQDAHEVLREQHNPALLSQSPPTVLVADSENDRVVEYARIDGEWERTWLYDRGLAWPRDADRLPNGNTLIVDTRNQRALEVTPDGDVVWEVRIPEMPYDVERLHLGDEPTGPTARSLNATGTAGDDGGRGALATVWSEVTTLHGLAQWILPPWVSPVDFLAVAVAIGTTLSWAGVELLVWLRPRVEGYLS